MELLALILYIIAIVFSIILHEVAHGLVANSMGDDTARNAGRLTLNPLKHIDPIGSILLPLITWQFGFIFGYAKPVPYDPYNLNDRKYGPMKVALAGPLSNIALAILFGVVLRVLPQNIAATEFAHLLLNIVKLNIGLAVFNLVPIPPLDGHWILFALLPRAFDSFKSFLVRYSMPILIVFILFLFEYLMPLILFLVRVIVGHG